MAAATLSEDGLKKIRRVKRARGKVIFCKQNRLDARTFDNLCAGKFVRTDVISRVEQALAANPSRPTPDAVFRIMTAAYGINQRRLETPTRQAPYDEARMITALFLHEEAKLTKPEISKLLQYKDHTGAYVAIKSIRGTLDVDQALRDRVAELRGKLRTAAELATFAPAKPEPNETAHGN